MKVPHFVAMNAARVAQEAAQNAIRASQIAINNSLFQDDKPGTYPEVLGLCPVCGGLNPVRRRLFRRNEYRMARHRRGLSATSDWCDGKGERPLSIVFPERT